MPAGPRPESLPPIITAGAVDTIPAGTLPRALLEADAPGAVAANAPANPSLATIPDATATRKGAHQESPVTRLPLVVGLKMEHKKSPPFKRKGAPGLHPKMTRTDIIELTPARPELAALYVPWQDGTEFQGETLPLFACHQTMTPSPVRWETLNIGSDGDAQLDIKDLWFDAESCTVRSAASARVTFKAIAWDGTKPWLFAMRDEKGITFLLPRSDDVSVDAMVGAPVTVRGGFTRVTLPFGRWGSSSLVAVLPTLELNPPPAKPTGKASSVAQPAPQVSSEPVQVTVELAQAMSEKSPTLLVLRSRPASDRSLAAALK